MLNQQKMTNINAYSNVSSIGYCESFEKVLLPWAASFETITSIQSHCIQNGWLKMIKKS